MEAVKENPSMISFVIHRDFEAFLEAKRQGCPVEPLFQASDMKNGLTEELKNELSLISTTSYQSQRIQARLNRTN